jgi:hypothetical protein
MPWFDRNSQWSKGAIARLISALLLATISSSVPLPAQAGLPSEPMEWGQAELVPNLMPQAVQAAGSKVRAIMNGSVCSGQFIGADGFVTALHCLIGLFQYLHKDGPRLRPSSPIQGVAFKGWWVDRRNLLPFGISEHMTERFQIAGLDRAASLVLTGRGHFEVPPLVKDWSAFLGVEKAAKAGAWQVLQEDFALISFAAKGKGPQSKSDCFRIAKSDPKEGAPLWAVGYALELNRSTSSLESQRNVLRGEALKSWESLKEQSGLDGNVIPEEAWFDWQSQFIMSGPVKSGMSGGAVINQEGELVGIVIGVLPTTRRHTVVLRARFLLEDIKRQLGVEAAQRLSNCR